MGYGSCSVNHLVATILKQAAISDLLRNQVKFSKFDQAIWESALQEVRQWLHRLAVLNSSLLDSSTLAMLKEFVEAVVVCFAGVAFPIQTDQILS